MCEESMRTRFTAVEEGKGPGNEGTDFEDCSARLSLVEEDGRRVKAAARARRPTPPPRPSEQVTRTEPPCESGKPGVPEHPRAGFELVKFRGTFITQEGLRARGMKRIHGVLSGVAVALVAWVALLGSDVIDRPLVFAVSPADNRRSPAEGPTDNHSPPPPPPAPIHRDCVLRTLQPRHRRSQGVQLQDVPERAKVLARGEPSALRRHGRFGAR